ncbi:hypothetical protein [Salinibaculum rarum]|jgi:hypothetical protein|uniref:hypothetical protein n=1 Tax=Salinibaculum rarum TaxID=3058903 RepID=UPI00265F5F3D|nr:hypothetical protein [Salinibaculum sp. KK48]
MSWLARIGTHIYENKDGMVFDLVFALTWVTIVSAFVAIVDGPTWARYLLLVAGIPAYFGFIFSLKLAKEHEKDRS